MLHAIAAEFYKLLFLWGAHHMIAGLWLPLQFSICVYLRCLPVYRVRPQVDAFKTETHPIHFPRLSCVIGNEICL